MFFVSILSCEKNYQFLARSFAGKQKIQIFSYFTINPSTSSMNGWLPEGKLQFYTSLSTGHHLLAFI